MKALQAGLIGFGLSGRTFHKPLLEAAGIPVVACAVRNLAHQGPVDDLRFCSIEDLLSDDTVNLVVVASPNPLHEEHALQAIQAGKHVVIEKPLATTKAGAERIVRAARQAHGQRITVFQSRRLDGDFLTLASVLKDTFAGEWSILESRWGMAKPMAQGRWKDQEALGGGLLMDFFPHLLDQALVLNGLPDSITLEKAYQRENTAGADYLSATLRYGERRARLSVDCFSPKPGHRFRLAGSPGDWRCFGVDPQEARLHAGLSPLDETFSAPGDDQSERLCLFDGSERSLSLRQGDYLGFYRKLKAAIETEDDVPVSIEDAARVVSIIEALGETGVWLPDT